MRNEKFLRDFDWNLIMTFLVIVEEGGITAAAHRLLRTQPSVSNALSRLETSVGHKLIRRRRNAFQLTEYGRALHELAVQAGHSVETIGELARGDVKLTGKVSYQIASHMDCPALDAALRVFASQEPNVSFFAETVPSNEIVKNLMSGTIGIGFCVLKEPISQLTCQLLNENFMGFYCGSSHPLFNEDGLTMDDLAQHNYVSFESDHVTAGLESVARVGIGWRFRENKIAVSPNDEEVLRLIEAGVGFGPLMLHVAQPLEEAGRLRRLPPLEESLTVKNYLVTNPKHSRTAVEARFLEEFDVLLGPN